MTLIYSTYFTFAIAILFPPNRAGPEQQRLPSPRTLSRARRSPNARHTSVPETEGAHQAGVAGLRALGRPDDAKEAGRCTGSGVSCATCDAGNFDGRTMGRRLAWLNRRYRGRGVYRMELGMRGLDLQTFPAPPGAVRFPAPLGDVAHPCRLQAERSRTETHLVQDRRVRNRMLYLDIVHEVQGLPDLRRTCSTRPCVRRGPVEEDEGRDDGGVGLGPEGDRTASADPHRERQRPATHLRARGMELERGAAPGTPLLSSTTTPQ